MQIHIPHNEGWEIYYVRRMCVIMSQHGCLVNGNCSHLTNSQNRGDFCFLCKLLNRKIPYFYISLRANTRVLNTRVVTYLLTLGLNAIQVDNSINKFFGCRSKIAFTKDSVVSGVGKSVSMGRVVHRNFMGVAIKIGYERQLNHCGEGPKREPHEL